MISEKVSLSKLGPSQVEQSNGGAGFPCHLRTSLP